MRSDVPMRWAVAGVLAIAFLAGGQAVPVGVAVAGPDPAGGLTLRLDLKTPADSLRVGESLVFDVVVRNSGDRALAVPIRHLLLISAHFAPEGVLTGSMRGFFPSGMSRSSLTVMAKGAESSTRITLPLRVASRCDVRVSMSWDGGRIFEDSRDATVADPWVGRVAVERSLKVNGRRSDLAERGGPRSAHPSTLGLVSALGASIWGPEATERSAEVALDIWHQGGPRAAREVAFWCACAAVERAWGASAMSRVLSEDWDTLTASERLAQVDVAALARGGAWTRGESTRSDALLSSVELSYTATASDEAKRRGEVVLERASRDEDPVIRARVAQVLGR